MKVRIKIRIWIRIQDSYEGSYQDSYPGFVSRIRLIICFIKVSLYFGATFKFAFEKYTFLNRFEKYLGS